MEEKGKKQQLRLEEMEMENLELKNKLAIKQHMVDEFRSVLLDNPSLKSRMVASPDSSLKDELSLGRR